MMPSARPFRVVRAVPGEVRVEFPRRLTVGAFVVLALGVAVTCLLAIPMVKALRSGGATSKYGYGFGAGVAMTGLGFLLLAGRRQVLVTDRSIVHRMLIAGYPALTSEVAKADVASIRSEDDGGDHFIRIYPTTGPRIHIEGFASRDERDWFLAQLLLAIEDAGRAFLLAEDPAKHAP